MVMPFKIKVKNFIKEFLCFHNRVIKNYKQCGSQKFIICECLECGKVWVE